MTTPTSWIVRRAVVWFAFAACTPALACHRPNSAAPFLVAPRYWLQSEANGAALAAMVQHIRTSVASSLSEGVLEDGFPRDCTVTEPEIRAAPFYPECIEDGSTPDGLLLDASGRFIQFVPIDFLSARLFLFEVYLIPDAATAAALTPESLMEYPHVAIPHVDLSESTYRQLLSAIMRGIQATGAEPL